MMTMLYIIITLLSMMIMLTNNPMNLSLVIIIMSMIMSLLISMELSSWFAMLLLLIFIGGLMVMFSYFISFSSNDSMFIYSKIYMMTVPLITMKMFNMHVHSLPYTSAKIYNLYSSMNTSMMLIIAMVLLFMMILITKMVKTNNAPLRGFTVN